MAYFDCQIVQGGGGVTDIPLIVICTSAFAGLTISCTDGITTFTAQCPSSSPYTIQFDLPNAGTWTVSGTISGTTYSESIIVQDFELELKNNITKTITVYSAANDTVSYTGIDGQTHTITTNSSGSATAQITISPSGSIFIFTSSVAKNPNNLSSAYTKQITITTSTSSIYIMPDGEVGYWYGYKGSGWGGLAELGYTYNTKTAGNPTYNTNNLGYDVNYVGFATNTAKSYNNKTFNIVGQTSLTTYRGLRGGYVPEKTVYYNTGNDYLPFTAENTKQHISASLIQSNVYLVVINYEATGSIDAIWIV